jgi:hypothetical protein
MSTGNKSCALVTGACRVHVCESDMRLPIAE